MSSWIRICLLLLVTTACGFPRPPDVPDDRCARDEDCGGATPVCVEQSCSACRDSAGCPGSRPVCDDTSHDCRSCVSDGECDSGACDLAAGTCVDQGAILYASPTGTAADPCTRSSPCSLRRAAELVDAMHGYIVLQPGHHEGGARFSHKTAILVGDAASIDVTDTYPFSVDISDGSSIVMRDISINEHLTVAGSDLGAAVGSVNSELTLDNVRSYTQAILAIAADKVTIRHSDFVGYAVEAARMVVDSCIFHTEGPRTTDSIEMSNSIVFAIPPRTAIWLKNPAASTQLTSRITNNTFIGGSILCEPTAAFTRIFDSNILYNQETISVGDGCVYQYNLITRNPDVGGTGNITEDPLFTDIVNNDLHLKPGSPAIDAADPADTSIHHDFDGTPRPQGTRSDIGAFEYVPTR